MIRFALKSAFWLGVLAFALPFVHGTSETGTAKIDVLGAVVGAQQALADLGSFCERAPQACATGREVGAFAGERIEEGARIAYGLVNGATADPAPAALEAAAQHEPDPVTTGTVEALSSGPRPYQPPHREPVAALELPAPEVAASVPTPTPRP